MAQEIGHDGSLAHDRSVRQPGVQEVGGRIERRLVATNRIEEIHRHLQVGALVVRERLPAQIGKVGGFQVGERELEMGPQGGVDRRQNLTGLFPARGYPGKTG